MTPSKGSCEGASPGGFLSDQTGARLLSAQNFHFQAEEFLASLRADLDARRIQWPDHWDVDHVCYRVESEARYLSMKALLAGLGRLLAESEVNGRLIATYQLQRPLEQGDWRIDLVELPAPKPFKKTVEGFEHIEVVADEPFELIQRRFLQADFDHGGMSKNFNAELELRIGPRAVKFHHLSLESVIRLETNDRVWGVLRDSRVLEQLKDLRPLVTGTFPLGIAHAESDLDIVLECPDLDVAAKRVQGLFQHEKNFRIERRAVQGIDTLLATFEFGGVALELFGQPAPSTGQRAFRHFLVEERLLKFGGEEFASRIRRARASGTKTEPAFAEVLRLEGDPFERLLEIQRWGTPELRSLFR